MYMNPSLFQNVLVVRRLVCILKPSPSANVENQHYPEAVPACLNIVEKSLESRPVRKRQATLTEVRIRLYYVHAEQTGIRCDSFQLVLWGILLMFRRHADVLGRR